MKTIEIIPTDDLIEEIKSRFDHVVIAARGKRIKGQGDYHSSIWEGDKIICMGLCEYVKTDLAHAMKDEPTLAKEDI